ncbi:MAG: glycosyltransferase, partial [Candidatus Methanomethylicaceae archaeon]
SEADNIRRMGLTNRVEVIPNGVDVSDFECGLTREELEFMFPKIKGRTLVLFLGRIHPKKGLLNLVIAFKKVRSLYPDVILLIAGPDERGHKREVEECVRQEGLNEDVLFLGPVSGELKVGLLKNSDVFVLPSYSEGFPVAVLEALACKLPVVLTKYCNVPEVAEAGAGIEVDISPYQIANAIIILLSDHKMRKQMGENGYRLVLERFNWDRVAKMTINLCSEVIR